MNTNPPTHPAGSAPNNPAPSSSAFAATATTSTAPSGGGGGDKYAALASLDDVFGSTGNEKTVNWDGGMGGVSSGGPISWGGGGSGGPSGMVGVGPSPAPSTGVFGGGGGGSLNTTSGRPSGRGGLCLPSLGHLSVVSGSLVMAVL